jgi:Phage minor capsid protein 2
MDRERLNQYAQPVVDLYNQLELSLLGNIAKLVAQDRDLLDTDPEKWNLQKMQQIGMLSKANLTTMKNENKLKGSSINKILLQAGLEGLSDNEAFFKEATKKGARLIQPDTDPDKSPAVLTIIQAFVRQAAKVLNLTNSTMLDQAKQIYKDIVNKSSMDVANGFITGEQAIRKSIRQWANQGVPALIRKDGAKLSPEGYVRTVMVSTTNNVVNAAQDVRMEEYGVDLVEVTSHIGARPKCAPFQGRIFSISGKDKKYPPLAMTSMGQPDGLFGINCGHDKYPFIEGVSQQRYFPYPDDQNKEVYDESQKQRYLERQIRAAKRQQHMYEQAGDQAAAQQAKQLVRARQKKMREFIKDTGRTRRSGREQIETGKENPDVLPPPPVRKDPDPKPDIPKVEPKKEVDKSNWETLTDQQKQMIRRRNKNVEYDLDLIKDKDKVARARKGLANGEFDEAPLIITQGKNDKDDLFFTERDKDGLFQFEDDENAPDEHSILKSLNNLFTGKKKDEPKPQPADDDLPDVDFEDEIDDEEFPEMEEDTEPDEEEQPKPKKSNVKLTTAQQKKTKEYNDRARSDLKHMKDRDKAAELERRLDAGEFDNAPLLIEYDRDSDDWVPYETKMINGAYVARLKIDGYEEYVDYDLAEDIIKNSPYKDKLDGLLIKLGQDSSAAASYRGSADSMIIPPAFDKKYLDDDITEFTRTFYHELGHRVHQCGDGEMPDIDYAEQSGITGNITLKQWKEWKKFVQVYWNPKDTDVHPEVKDRMNYPVNAKHRYKGGKKSHFQMEMFAEASSYYLENDKEEMAKLEKHYPGLLDQMEKIYGYGNWKGKDEKPKKDKVKKEKPEKKVSKPKPKPEPEPELEDIEFEDEMEDDLEPMEDEEEEDEISDDPVENFQNELKKADINKILKAKDQFGNDKGPMAEKVIQQEIKNYMLKISNSRFATKFEDLKGAWGCCEVANVNNKKFVDRFLLHDNDKRPIEVRLKTMFHEYYHAKMEGQPSYHMVAMKTDDWVDWEETMTEAASHKMLRLAGVKGEIPFSYADKLVRNLPKLKKLPEFKNCKTIEDFGEVALKYRFGKDSDKTIDWSKLQDDLGSKPKRDFVKYIDKHYKDYAMEHKDELIDVMMMNLPGDSRDSVERAFNSGWSYYEMEKFDNVGFSMSLAIVMNRIGVK